jgi:hypothetical protein
MNLVPAYYYDLYIEIDGGKLQLVDKNFPVWLSEKDFEREWVSLGRSIIDYRELQQEMEEGNLIAEDNILSSLLFDPVDYYRRRKVWQKFRQGYIEKTKRNLIHKYNLTIYKNGKWLITIVDTTIKAGTNPFINYLRNLNNCTEKLDLKQFINDNCDSYGGEIRLLATTKTHSCSI